MAKSKKSVASKGVDLSSMVTNGKKAVTVPVADKDRLQAQAEALKHFATGVTVVTHIGDPNKATIPLTGEVVYRKEAIFVDEMNEMVECLPYDNHFIYENPAVFERNEYGPLYLCTCGASAIIVYGGDNVPDEAKGKFACAFDANTGFKGKHSTDVLNASDFGKKDLSDPIELPN